MWEWIRRLRVLARGHSFVPGGDAARRSNALTVPLNQYRQSLAAPTPDGPYDYRSVSADVELFVELADGGWGKVPFRIDSGSSVTAIRTNVAIMHGLPLDRASPPFPSGVTTAAGRVEETLRVGRIRVCFSLDWINDPFEITVTYMPPLRNEDGSPAHSRPLLGLGGVIHQMRWTFVGEAEFPYEDGYCLLEDARP